MPGMLKPVGGMKPAQPKSFRRSFLAPNPTKPQVPKPAAGMSRPGAGAKPGGSSFVVKRDDGVIHAVGKPKTPTATQRRIDAQKKAQAVTSLAGGTLGLTALATRGRSAQLARRAAHVPADAKVLTTRAGKLKDISTALTTAGAGIGGAAAFNFASYTNAEAKQKKVIAKNLPIGTFGEVDKGFTMPKSLSNTVHNFRNGFAHPAGFEWKHPNGKTYVQADAATKSGRTGQRVARRLGSRDERGGVLPTVTRSPKTPKTPKGSTPPNPKNLSEEPSQYTKNPSFPGSRSTRTAIAVGAGGVAGGGAVGFYLGNRRKNY